MFAKGYVGDVYYPWYCITSLRLRISYCLIMWSNSCCTRTQASRSDVHCYHIPGTKSQQRTWEILGAWTPFSVSLPVACAYHIRMLDKLLTEEWGKSWNIAPQNQVTSNRRRPWKPMAFQRPCTTAWWRLVSGSWFHVWKYWGMYNYSHLSPNLLAFSMGKMMRNIFKHGGGSISTTFRGGLTQQNCNYPIGGSNPPPVIQTPKLLIWSLLDDVPSRNAKSPSAALMAAVNRAVHTSAFVELCTLYLLRLI